MAWLFSSWMVRVSNLRELLIAIGFKNVARIFPCFWVFCSRFCALLRVSAKRSLSFKLKTPSPTLGIDSLKDLWDQTYPVRHIWLLGSSWGFDSLWHWTQNFRVLLISSRMWAFHSDVRILRPHSVFSLRIGIFRYEEGVTPQVLKLGSIIHDLGALWFLVSWLIWKDLGQLCHPHFHDSLVILKLLLLRRMTTWTFSFLPHSQVASIFGMSLLQLL